MIANIQLRKVILILICAQLLLGCKERQPAINTPEYMALHGFSPGKVAELRVGGHLFHIPSDVQLQMITNGNIIKGQADYLLIWLRDFKPQATGATSIPGPSYGELWLQIEIFHAPGTRDGRGEGFEHERPWSSIREIPDWQLKEYRASNFNSKPQFSYEGVGDAPRTPMGNPVRFTCTDTYPNHGQCSWSSYRLNPEIQINYIFPTEWIPIWQQVHQHVISTVEHYHQPSKP